MGWKKLAIRAESCAIREEAVERLVIMCLAVLATFAFAWLPPVSLPGIEGGLRSIGARLNRPIRSDGDRMIRGVLMVVFFGALGAVLGGILGNFLERLGALGVVVSTVFLAFCMASPARQTLLRHFCESLAKGDEAKATVMAAHLARQNVPPPDGHAAARIVIAEIARDVERHFATPLFWFLLAGFPGLGLVCAVSEVDGAVGINNKAWHSFGSAAANLNTALRWLPTRISAFVLALSAVFVDGGKPHAAWATAVRYAGRHPSRTGGWPVAAMAGALGVMLGRPGASGHGWIGSGALKIGLAEVRRARRLVFVVRLILAAACAGLALLVR